MEGKIFAYACILFVVLLVVMQVHDVSSLKIVNS